MFSKLAPAAATSPLADAWKLPSLEMPDSDITVLIHCPAEAEPVWIGYHDGAEWQAAEGGTVQVTHWQHFPAPPPAPWKTNICAVCQRPFTPPLKAPDKLGCSRPCSIELTTRHLRGKPKKKSHQATCGAKRPARLSTHDAI